MSRAIALYRNNAPVPSGGTTFVTFSEQMCQDASNLFYDPATGITYAANAQLGTTTAKLVGFYGTAPIAQRAGAAQAAVVGTAATNSSPFGYSQAQADAIVTLVNELRAAMVALGIIKGAA